MSERYLPIDEEGYFVFDGRRVDDEDLGRQLLQNLQLNENAVTTSMDGQSAWVEAFDAPLIVKHLEWSGGKLALIFPYQTKFEAQLDSLSIDEWDRFHGMTAAGVPFVFSRHAQIEFFDGLDEFDDDSVTIQGRRYATPPWLISNEEVGHSSFWTSIYQNEPKPGWDLGQAHPALGEVLPQLRLNKARVLVLGCGAGHDAAYFARQGHVVTAVDFSAEALQRAQASYGEIEDLTFVQADALKLPESFHGRYDLIFEHTCYCAIPPDRRNDLLRVWNRALVPGGHLLGVFFVNEKRNGPPWGGSEWELRERLKKDFQFLYWTRWRHSLERRKGKELVLYARQTR